MGGFRGKKKKKPAQSKRKAGIRPVKDDLIKPREVQGEKKGKGDQIKK